MTADTENATKDTVQIIAARRLRRFLLVLAGLIFIGSTVELWLAEHFEDPLQLVPFILCGLGFLTVVAALIQAQRTTLTALRVVMTIVFLGSLFGIFEHLEHNIAFAMEIQPNAALREVFIDALGGANPLLAPGILALGAVLAIAATYYHPAFEGDYL